MQSVRSDAFVGVFFAAMCMSASAAETVQSGDVLSESLTQHPRVIYVVYYQDDVYAWPVDAVDPADLSTLEHGDVYVFYLKTGEGDHRIFLTYDSTTGAFLFPSNVDIEFGDAEAWLELVQVEGDEKAFVVADEERAEAESGTTPSASSSRPGTRTANGAGTTYGPGSPQHVNPFDPKPVPPDLLGPKPWPDGLPAEPNFVGPVIYCGCIFSCSHMQGHFIVTVSGFYTHIPFNECYGTSQGVLENQSCTRTPYFSYSVEDCDPAPEE